MKTRRMTKEEKATERLVDEACQRLSCGYQIDIMKLDDMHKAGTEAAKSGGDVDAAIRAWLEANATKTSF